MTYKIAVVGEYDSVLPFQSVGLNIFPTDSADHVRHTLRKLADQDYAIIYVTEQAAQNAMDEVLRYTDRPRPAIILIPGRNGSLLIGKKAVKHSVERAVGADIISGTLEQSEK